MLLSSGLHTAPCGVPCSGVHSSNPSSTRRDQLQNATVRHLLPDPGEKTVFGNCVEVALQIGVDDVDVARIEQFIDPPQRVPRFREGRVLQPRPGRKP